MQGRDLHAQGNFDRVMFASITGVNQKQGTVSIVFNDQFGFRDDVPIPVLAMGKDAWIRFIPQINDIVHVGIRGDDSAVIVGWHPWSYKARTSGYDGNEKNAAGGSGQEMMASLKPGEIDMRAAGGGYLRFNNIGDVLMMSLAGRMQMNGIEGTTELAQNAIKITDGKSSFRFGQSFRTFTGVNERELPTEGQAAPSNRPTDLREMDLRLYDSAGNLLFQQSVGTVVDEQGQMEVSGTSGNGVTVKSENPPATNFAKGNPADFQKSLTQKLGKMADSVVDTVKSQISSIKNSINTVINGTGGSLDDIASTASDLSGIITGEGSIASGADALTGIGPVGNTLRNRTVIQKDGKQVYANDVDDKGGVTQSTNSESGFRLNALKGGINLFAKKGLELFAKTLIAVADNITDNAKQDIKQIAGGDIRRIAGGDIRDNGSKVNRTAQESITDTATTSVGIEAGTTLTAEGATVSITADGTITIQGGGIVTIQGAIVNIN